MIFNLTSGAIPMTAKVAGFRGTERISRPYVFDVYFTLESFPNTPLAFDLNEAVFAKAKLSIQLGNEPEQPYHGIFASVRLVRASDNISLFHATLVPQLWQLTLTKHSRIWTKKSSVDVIKEVLDEAGIEYEFRTQASYPVEEHITQYKESNLAFITRWMDREGMYYWFEQTDGADLLVIADNKAAHESLRLNPVKYFPQTNYEDVLSQQAFDNLAASHNALPASVKLIDYDYAKPLLDVSATISVESNAVGEITEYGGRFFTPADAQRIANVRAEEQLATKDVFEITGAATQLSAGYKFTVEDHPLFQYNAEYLCTTIEHHGYDTQFASAWGSLVKSKYTDVYRVELAAIPAETQFRNPQSPWPRVDGYENAVVDGAANSQYAQIDDQGRYNVKFKFDEGTLNNGKASTFIRMVQPHGGPQEGHHFPLRKGVEVVCSFLGGDPDRPVINGVVHNMLNQSVVTQNNYTQNVIRTGSLNHIVMEDTAGSMYIDVWCPIFSSTLFLGFGTWNFNLTTQGCGQIQTTLNLNIDVDQWWTVDVVNYVDWHFHNTQNWVNDLAVTWKFDNTFTWEVTSNVDIKWMATLNHYIKGAATIKFDNTVDLTVTGNTTANFNANVTATVKGNLDLHVKTHETHKVDAGRELTVKGDQTIDVTANQVEKVHGQYDLTVDGNWNTEVKAQENKTVHGPTNETFIGLKTDKHIGAKFSLSLGYFNEWTVGMKQAYNIGLFTEFTLAAKAAITVGALMDITLGAKLSGHMGPEAEFSPSPEVKMKPVNIKMTSVTINIGAPRIYIQAIELHI
ncbi:MAG: type VI secretion system tip protein VgrG [Myxococcales bacterium]|nr:type VI secretion system tip protein VgrG [Myxococcales bacterium]